MMLIFNFHQANPAVKLAQSWAAAPKYAGEGRRSVRTKMVCSASAMLILTACFVFFGS
jgi:hypothetical protein